VTAERPTPESSADVVRRFDACGFARLLGLETAGATGGCVRVIMRTEGMENAHGTTHGGAIFALADHAFGIAGNLDGVDQTAISAHIRYFSPPATGTLEAVARKVSETERTSVYAVDVFSGDRRVASFEGIGFKTGAVPERGWGAGPGA